ncbi:MAG: type II toxin-antitoxin system VapB family antitoxin [Cyanobacteria bacterium P01_H01_bin.152]
MATSLNVDETLLQEALALDENMTLDMLMNIALREYIERRKRLNATNNTDSLCGAFEVNETDAKYRIETTEEREVITNYAEHVDEVIY